MSLIAVPSQGVVGMNVMVGEGVGVGFGVRVLRVEDRGGVFVKSTNLLDTPIYPVPA